MGIEHSDDTLEASSEGPFQSPPTGRMSKEQADDDGVKHPRLQRQKFQSRKTFRFRKSRKGFPDVRITSHDPKRMHFFENLAYFSLSSTQCKLSSKFALFKVFFNNFIPIFIQILKNILSSKNSVSAQL